MAYQKWSDSQITELRLFAKRFDPTGSTERFTAREWNQLLGVPASLLASSEDIKLGQKAARLSIYLKVPVTQKTTGETENYVNTAKAYDRRILEAITGKAS